MKNKLIELIERAMDEGFAKHIPLTSSFLADQLISNNVFVLPEKMKDSWELALPFIMRLFVADEAEIEKIKREFECKAVKQILTDIRNYLVAIIDEWYKRIDEPNFYEQNIGVYNHIRKELDDLDEYAKKLGGGVVKKIKIDGSEIKVLDYEWRKETFNHYGELVTCQFTIDYIKIKICRENFKELLQKVLFSNKYVIEADDKKAEFFLMPFELYKIKNEIENEEIEIEFTGTGNEVL